MALEHHTLRLSAVVALKGILLSACPVLAGQMIRQLEQLDLVSIERKARVLTHQLASLTLLAYTKSLAEHKDAPMFGHTVRRRRAAATNSFNQQPG